MGSYFLLIWGVGVVRIIFSFFEDTHFVSKSERPAYRLAAAGALTESGCQDIQNHFSTGQLREKLNRVRKKGSFGKGVFSEKSIF